MYKRILLNDEARKKLLNGSKMVFDCVKVTLGPRGKFGIVDSPNFGVPVITKDGVSLAKEVVLKDKFENLGAKLTIDIASKSNDVGDGTTTATILGYALTKEGLKSMDSGVSSVDLNKGIEVATKDATNLILLKSKKVDKIEDLYNVAKVSSNNDEKIAKYVSEAFEKVGNDGLISVSESDNGETYLSFKEGMSIDRGYVVPYFINNEKLTCEFDNPYVLVTDENLSSTKQIIGILNEVASEGRPLVIVTNDVEVQSELIKTLIINNAKGSIRVNVVKAPSYGENRSNILSDIAVLTGATFVSDKLGVKLSDVHLNMLGECDKIVSSKDETVFIGGRGDEDEIENRINFIQKSIENETSDSSKENLKDRLAKLSGGVCVLNVYAQTDPQMKELKDRVEDTLCSVRASIKEGIVLGGGVTLALISEEMTPSEELTDDEMIGYNLFRNVLKYPIRQLAENSNLSPDVILNETLKNSNGKSGYNMLTREWDDNLVDKVVDPTLVEVSALKNASSIVTLMLNSEVIMINETDDEKNCNCK